MNTVKSQSFFRTDSLSASHNIEGLHAVVFFPFLFLCLKCLESLLTCLT